MMPKTTRDVLLMLSMAGLAAAAGAAASEPRAPLFPADFEGATIALVYVDLRDPSGAELDEPPLRDELARASGLTAGSAFSTTATGAATCST